MFHPTGISWSRFFTNPKIFLLIIFQLMFLSVMLSTFISHSPMGLSYTLSKSTTTKTSFHSMSVINDKNVEPGKATQNATLGFGEIMYISMPTRTDRQDAMNLLAASSGLTLTLVPGVDGTIIPEKAKPDNYYGHVNKNEMGCWRAHANAWRRVLESPYNTALILEDDIDWDVNIKNIMGTLSAELRNNSLRSKPAIEGEESAPYALDWDVLMVGQCLHGMNKGVDAKTLAQSFIDPHAPRRNQTSSYWTKQLEAYSGKVWQDGKKRVLVKAHTPVCTMGYAITREGAKKLLYHLGYNGLTGAIDLALAEKLKVGAISGYVVIPPPINAWRVGGGKDSDINNGLKVKPIGKGGNKKGHSENLRESARKAFEGLWGANKGEKVGGELH